MDGLRQDYPLRAWRQLPGDSIWIGHPAAFAGYVLRLTATGDVLTGIVTSYSDVAGREPLTRSVRLERVECPLESGEDAGA